MEKTNKSLFLWIIFFVFFFVIITLRRPDIIFHAQPWAEDGKIWISGIYNDGFFKSILLPQNGYYQTISRITYSIALMFGLSNAALVANSIAISIRCLFMMFILSERMSYIKLKYRISTVIYFILMPNLSEGYVNITNAHWYLSMYLMAVVLSDDAQTTLWKIHDYALLIISSLSGPFVVFIAPGLLIKRMSQRGGFVKAVKGINVFDIIMALCCIIQVAAILISSGAERSNAPLGGNFHLLADIVSYRVIGGAFFPNYIISGMANHSFINVILFSLLAVLLFVFFIRSDWRFRSACIFTVLVLGFTLAKPMMTQDQPQWPVFLIPGTGERYFL